MASSKVARRRQGSLPKEPPPSVDISDSDGEKDSGLDDFEIIKTIGKLLILYLCIYCCYMYIRNTVIVFINTTSMFKYSKHISNTLCI